MTYLPTEEPITVHAEEPVPGIVVVRVGGEVDMLSSPVLREAVAAALTGHRSLVIDLTAVAFLGTSGLATLIEARSAVHRDGTQLWLACAQRAVVRPLRIAGLVELFQIAATTEAALAALAAGSGTNPSGCPPGCSAPG